jgi:hypothetical protein
LNITELHEEVKQLLSEIDLSIDGEHLWENYQKITAYLLRLGEIHNELAWLEISGEATPEIKKFRTMIIDPTIDRLEKAASYESRKITAKSIEWQMERSG